MSRCRKTATNGSGGAPQPAGSIAASIATHKVTEARRFYSRHLPKIMTSTGGEKQIESVVILECCSEYYTSEDPATYNPLLDLCVASHQSYSTVH